MNRESYELNFTNGGGVDGTFRFLKDIMGGSLIWESGRTWVSRGEEYAISGLAEVAEEACPFSAVVEPGNPVFHPPGDMPARIAGYSEKAGQGASPSEGGAHAMPIGRPRPKMQMGFREAGGYAGEEIE
jgi:rhamnulokinase